MIRRRVTDKIDVFVSSPHSPSAFAPYEMYTSTVVRPSPTHCPAFQPVPPSRIIGVSILLTMMLLKRRRELGLHKTEVLCYAFAPPPVFGPLHKLSGETRRAIRAFVFGNDMVCRLSLASAYGLFRDLKEVDAIGVSGVDVSLGLALLADRDGDRPRGKGCFCGGCFGFVLACCVRGILMVVR